MLSVLVELEGKPSFISAPAASRPLCALGGKASRTARLGRFAPGCYPLKRMMIGATIQIGERVLSSRSSAVPG